MLAHSEWSSHPSWDRATGHGLWGLGALSSVSCHPWLSHLHSHVPCGTQSHHLLTQGKQSEQPEHLELLSQVPSVPVSLLSPRVFDHPEGGKQGGGMNRTSAEQCKLLRRLVGCALQQGLGGSPQGWGASPSTQGLNISTRLPTASRCFPDRTSTLNNCGWVRGDLRQLYTLILMSAQSPRSCRNVGCRR